MTVPEQVRNKLTPTLSLIALSIMLILQGSEDWMMMLGWVLLVLGAVVETALK